VSRRSGTGRRGSLDCLDKVDVVLDERGTNSEVHVARRSRAAHRLMFIYM
jgi:hypothetical protein